MARTSVCGTGDGSSILPPPSKKDRQRIEGMLKYSRKILNQRTKKILRESV